MSSYIFISIFFFLSIDQSIISSSYQIDMTSLIFYIQTVCIVWFDEQESVHVQSSYLKKKNEKTGDGKIIAWKLKKKNSDENNLQKSFQNFAKPKKKL